MEVAGMETHVVTVTKILEFAAAHHLPGYEGCCSRTHGHTYRLEIEVAGRIVQTGSEAGMVIDFTRLKGHIEQLILHKLDHHDLNQTLDFRPTAENMVLWIVEELERLLGLREPQLTLVRVRLWETPTSYAEVRL